MEEVKEIEPLLVTGIKAATSGFKRARTWLGRFGGGGVQRARKFGIRKGIYRRPKRYRPIPRPLGSGKRASGLKGFRRWGPPDSFHLKVPITYIVSETGTASGFEGIEIPGNSILDPFGLGQNPVYVDYLFNLYERFIVTGSKAVMSCYHTSTLQHMYAMWANTKSGTTVDFEDVLAQPYLRYKIACNAGAGNTNRSISYYRSTSSVCGRNPLFDREYSGDSANDPEVLWYWHFGMSNVPPSATAKDGSFLFQMIYYVTFYDLKDQTQFST